MVFPLCACNSGTTVEETAALTEEASAGQVLQTGSPAEAVEPAELSEAASAEFSVNMTVALLTCQLPQKKRPSHISSQLSRL